MQVGGTDEGSLPPLARREDARREYEGPAGGSDSKAENARRWNGEAIRACGLFEQGLGGANCRDRPQLMRSTTKISLRLAPLIYLTSFRRVCYTACQIAVVM